MRSVRLPAFPALPGRTSAAISPTAHYTGEAWAQLGLSHPALRSLEGRALHLALRPYNVLSTLAGGPSIDAYLQARHAAIDAALDAAITDGRVGQVVEIACGMSPRGWRVAERHGAAVEYIEADLPDMAARKRAALAQIGAPTRVVTLDALADDGPDSLSALARTLDPDKGLAIITEGLLNYFPAREVLGMWDRFARTLRGFPHGLYLADVHLGGDGAGPHAQVFSLLLGAFVRGGVHLHPWTATEAHRRLQDAGFDGAELHRPQRYVRVIEAVTATRSA